MIANLDLLLSQIAAGLLVVLLVPLTMTLLRMLRGPSYADRFVALDMLTGLAVAMGALTMAATGRREFLDVALGLAIFGFVGTCALEAFLEHKGGGKS